MKYFLLALLVLLVGCTQHPTQITQKQEESLSYPLPQPRKLPTSGTTEWAKPVDTNAIEVEMFMLKHPLMLLKTCLKTEINNYTLNFWKKEFQHPLEIIDVVYRDKPLSVYFHWKQGSRGPVKSLYVEGENQNKIVTLMNLGITVKRDPHSADAMKYGRYPMNKFGLRQAVERVIEGCKTAKIEYLGLYKVTDTGGVICHTFHLQHTEPKTDQEAYIFIDTERLLQVGSVVLDQVGNTLGEYYFRDINLNPQFAPSQFSPGVVRK